MRVAIATVQVPFISGGAEILAASLRRELVRRGHLADIVTLPFKWYPVQALRDCMEMGRRLDLSEVNGERIERVIALKFPAYYLAHHSKVVWLLHQHRQAYDLWETPFGDLHGFEGGSELRRDIIQMDGTSLAEAKGLYTISRRTAQRLRAYNGLAAEVLYHPPTGHERLHCSAQEPFIFYPSRIDGMKRQTLLVEAAGLTRSGVGIVLAGGGSPESMRRLQAEIEKRDLESRVKILGFISEEEKIDTYSRCLAVYFGAYDEDYGYVALEALWSSKPVIAHTDAGGPLEFIQDGVNGLVVAADAAALASGIDGLALDTARAREMGRAGRDGLARHRMDWDHVVDTLLE
ncbi:MAG: glycosyltransferase family 4 protein [Acidobacteriota bacterium]